MKHIDRFTISFAFLSLGLHHIGLVEPRPWLGWFFLVYGCCALILASIAAIGEALK